MDGAWDVVKVERKVFWGYKFAKVKPGNVWTRGLVSNIMCVCVCSLCSSVLGSLETSLPYLCLLLASRIPPVSPFCS